MAEFSTGLDWSMAEFSTGLDWSITEFSTGLDWSITELSTGLDWSMVEFSTGLDWSMVEFSTGLDWSMADTQGLFCNFIDDANGDSTEFYDDDDACMPYYALITRSQEKIFKRKCTEPQQKKCRDRRHQLYSLENVHDVSVTTLACPQAGLGPPRMGFRGNGGTDVQGKCGPAQVDAPHKRPPDAHVFPRLGPLTGDGNSFLILTTPNITSEVTAGLMESSLSSLSLSLLTVAKSPRFQLYLKVVCWGEKEIPATSLNQRCKICFILRGILTTQKQENDNAISE
uniref:Uncharacterized protein n=1 Tax=Timema poppense TaxID=170557 RepID=A0A7R9DLD4_TIMPO|nr:unnamed protein product [Timema poppensis]